MASAQKILLVEDNDDDIELTIHAFKKTRLENEIVVARDGETALNYLFHGEIPEGEQPDKGSGDVAGGTLPALMLLDLQLPGISGLDVLRRVRTEAQTRRMPVVILTTSDDERDIIRGYDLGVNSYIRKPVDFATFTSLLDHLGLYWLGINVPAPQ